MPKGNRGANIWACGYIIATWQCHKVITSIQHVLKITHTSWRLQDQGAIFTTHTHNWVTTSFAKFWSYGCSTFYMFLFYTNLLPYDKKNMRMLTCDIRIQVVCMDLHVWVSMFHIKSKTFIQFGKYTQGVSWFIERFIFKRNKHEIMYFKCMFLCMEKFILDLVDA